MELNSFIVPIVYIAVVIIPISISRRIEQKANAWVDKINDKKIYVPGSLWYCLATYCIVIGVSGAIAGVTDLEPHQKTVGVYIFWGGIGAFLAGIGIYGFYSIKKTCVIITEDKIEYRSVGSVKSVSRNSIIWAYSQSGNIVIDTGEIPRLVIPTVFKKSSEILKRSNPICGDNTFSNLLKSEMNLARCL